MYFISDIRITRDPVVARKVLGKYLDRGVVVLISWHHLAGLHVPGPGSLVRNTQVVLLQGADTVQRH